MVGLPLLTFLRGGWGGAAYLMQKNVALQKVFFSYNRYGFELSFISKINSFMSY